MSATVCYRALTLNDWQLWTIDIYVSYDLQEARKAQLENHEPEDEEEDLDKDLQDSGLFAFILLHCVSHYLIFTGLATRWAVVKVSALLFTICICDVFMWNISSRRW